MICERCGCSELDACSDKRAGGEPCAWLRPGLCTACATEAELAAVFDPLLDQAAGDRGNPVLEAADLFNAGELGRAVPLLFDAYDRPIR